MVKKSKRAINPELETKEIIKPKRKFGKYIWGFLILAVLASGGYFVFGRGSTKTYKDAYTVGVQDIKQTVIGTGIVESEANLNLSFKTAGIVTKINVKVGDKVKAGAVLASLDQRDAQASVAVAQAAVQSAQVALKNAQNSYKNTLTQQTTLVNNAQATLLSTGLTAEAANSTVSTATISGTYSSSLQGQYKISLYQTSGDGLYFQWSGLESGSGHVTTSVPQPLGTYGLYITFSSSVSATDAWIVNVPNLKSSSYLTNYNALQTALQTQEVAIANAQGAVDSAEASLVSAKASLLVAQNNAANNVITAPIAGQITAVDIKLGEQAAALKEAIVLLDPNSLHVETDIPESSINLVRPDMDVDMTFDSLGPDKHLLGKVTSIDPASTVVSGVINFRVLSSLPKDPQIRPGMTVNLNIIIVDKPQVLAVPNRLINSSNGKKSVLVRTETGVSEVTIATGLVGDNFTEITSGLTNGMELVTEVK